MKKYEIEDLPKAVKSGKLTTREAANIIWEDVYTNPNDYGLFYLNEDQKSELLLKVHKNFEDLFKKFIPGFTSFKSFIEGGLTQQRNAYLREQMSKEAERKCIDSFLKSNIEEDIHKYSKDSTCEEENLFDENKKDFPELVGQDTCTNDKKNKRVAELTTLVLMMKACRDVDDETVSAVSDFTQLDKELLHDKILELKEKMWTKEKNHLKIVRKRNNAFFFHRKYMQEMISRSENDIDFENVKKRFMLQTKKWKEKNEILSQYSETPSNEEIARTIGIKPRMVSFYINHAKTDENMSKIKKIYEESKNTKESENQNEDNEDLPSKD